jgi:endonuclease-3 related protein
MYRRMLKALGPQGWWPGDTPFEVAVGAVLTQNTNWGNVERAIANLKRTRALSVRRIHALPHADLAELIRPAGYFNVKSRRLKNLVALLAEHHGGSMQRLARVPMDEARAALLGVNGVGPETADSIMLYALGHPVFVVDAYTRRIFPRHGLLTEAHSYDDFQQMFMRALKPDAGLYNEYHALIVMVGKTWCRPRTPRCAECPLGPMP